MSTLPALIKGNLSFKACSFNHAFDKGTIDGLLGNESNKDVNRAKRVVRELARIVEPGGFWINVGVSKPESRARQWERWWKRVETTRIPVKLEGHLGGAVNVYMNVYQRLST